MLAHQTMVADDGYEVMLFPLPYMNITQGENGQYSHQGTKNIDFIGWNSSGRVYQAPLYAPCTCKCIRLLDPNSNGYIFESTRPVHTPTGLQYINFTFAHDDNPNVSVGMTINQGDLIGNTGTAGNVTGDHVHFNCATGRYAGWETVPPANKGQLINSTHIYDICYINDTTIIDDYNYGWTSFDGDITPITRRNKKFKWVLYSRRIREKAQIK